MSQQTNPPRSVEDVLSPCEHATTHRTDGTTIGCTSCLADRIRASAAVQVAQARAEEREACAKIIPTNWTDPLLSGANAILQGYGPWGCPEIERLLSALAAAIRART